MKVWLGGAAVLAFGSVINTFFCTNRTEPASHGRVLKAKGCAELPWFSVPICPSVYGDAIRFSSQLIQFFAGCLYHHTVVHLAPPQAEQTNRAARELTAAWFIEIEKSQRQLSPPKECLPPEVQREIVGRSSNVSSGEGLVPNALKPLDAHLFPAPRRQGLLLRIQLFPVRRGQGPWRPSLRSRYRRH